MKAKKKKSTNDKSNKRGFDLISIDANKDKSADVSLMTSIPSDSAKKKQKKTNNLFFYRTSPSISIASISDTGTSIGRRMATRGEK